MLKVRQTKIWLNTKRVLDIKVASRSGAKMLAFVLMMQPGVISAAIVLNEMRRLTEDTRPKALDESTTSLPILAFEPLADCSRYDDLRRTHHVH